MGGIKLFTTIFASLICVSICAQYTPKTPSLNVNTYLFDSDWLVRISQETNKSELKTLLTKLQKQKPENTFDLQRAFFDKLLILAADYKHKKPFAASMFSFPPNEVYGKLDSIIGKGAASEFAAQWLYWIPAKGVVMRYKSYQFHFKYLQKNYKNISSFKKVNRRK